MQHINKMQYNLVNELRGCYGQNAYQPRFSKRTTIIPISISGTKFLADLQSDVLSQIGNLLNLLQKFLIHVLLKAKSIDPWTYSPHLNRKFKKLSLKNLIVSCNITFEVNISTKQHLKNHLIQECIEVDLIYSWIT